MGVRIPEAERAFIDRRKLVTYCLDATHPVGRHKAAVFRRVLGWTEEDAGTLHELLRRAIVAHEAAIGVLDEHGQRYVVDFPVMTAAGFATLRSA